MEPIDEGLFNWKENDDIKKSIDDWEPIQKKKNYAKVESNTCDSIKQ